MNKCLYGTHPLAKIYPSEVAMRVIIKDSVTGLIQNDELEEFKKDLEPRLGGFQRKLQTGRAKVTFDARNALYRKLNIKKVPKNWKFLGLSVERKDEIQALFEQTSREYYNRNSDCK
jgi:hypothetical protein